MSFHIIVFIQIQNSKYCCKSQKTIGVYTITCKASCHETTLKGCTCDMYQVGVSQMILHAIE